MMDNYNINQTTLRILGLYASDYKKSLHLREVARETKVDVKAVQLQLRKLEKINVLWSALKGRNKEYYLNLNNSITRYYMMLAETFASINYLASNFVIKKIIGEIGDKTEGIIVLFGSFAREEATQESDVDIFVLAERKLNESGFSEVGSLIGREINVKSMNKKRFLKGLEDGDPLIREVVSSHIVLKGVDEFCDIMWRYYARR